MKTLAQYMDEVCQSYGYNDWQHMVNESTSGIQVNEFLQDAIAKHSNQPPTTAPQQATSKSQDEFLKAVDRILELHSAEQEGIAEGMPTPKMWIDAVNDLTDARETLQQPHPQDSSSGEVKVPKTEGRYNTNRGELIWVPVFHSWYHVNGQPAPTPESWTETPPVSESLEQAAKRHIKENYPQYAYPEMLYQIFIDAAKWQSTQQQKPLVVLPTDEEIRSQAFSFSSQFIGRTTIEQENTVNDFVDGAKWLRDQLSAANGVVDLQKHVLDFINHLHEGGYEWGNKRYQLYLGGKYYWIHELYKKFTEQSQQQNKGTK